MTAKNIVFSDETVCVVEEGAWLWVYIEKKDAMGRPYWSPAHGYGGTQDDQKAVIKHLISRIHSRAT